MMAVLWSGSRCLALVVVLPLAEALFEGPLRECPRPADLVKKPQGGQAQVNFLNFSPVPLTIYWVNGDNERNIGKLAVQATTPQRTFVGHSFRFYHEGEDYSRTLIFQHTVEASDTQFFIESCGELQALERKMSPDQLLTGGRTKEFESLVHDQRRPCEPKGRSDQWSCINIISAADYARSRKEDGGKIYGFADKTEAGRRKVGEVKDDGYVQHIPKIPRMTDGPGFLKMNMTTRMKDAIKFLAENEHKAKEHKPIGGGYTNNHVKHFSILDLDDYRDVRAYLVDELRQIEQWWTQRPLVHTSTFGIRIYHREAMLINHVDRSDTHIASAVLQIDQSVDENGGWPLEVVGANGDVHEVYLQQGEMVLYEGGRFFHGRPMRFRGDKFANIFSHFAPVHWNGPGKSPKYEHHLAEKPEL